MSSRNVYLSPEERQAAPMLYRAMKESAGRLRAGDDVEAAMAGGAELIVSAGFTLDYFEVRHAETLAPIASVKDGPMRILVAAKIGKTRLIDNIGVRLDARSHSPPRAMTIRVVPARDCGIDTKVGSTEIEACRVKLRTGCFALKRPARPTPRLRIVTVSSL